MSIPDSGLNGLPAEVLCNIFRLIIDELNTAKEDRCRLMLVCRQWRQSVEGYALLWTGISGRDSPTYVRRALERSNEAMLDLCCWMYGMSHAELEAFMVEAGPHIARWRSVEITFRSAPASEGPLGPLTTTQAPNLEILAVYVATSAHLTSGNTITLFGGAPAPPTLKELMLGNIPVAIEPLNLSGLVSLDLIEVSTISTPQLLEILRRSPWLETLSLDHNSGLVAIASPASNIRSIELSKLDSLWLRWIDHGGANYILSNIRIPNRRRVEIRGHITAVSAKSVLFTSTITHLLHTTTPTADVLPSIIRVDQYSNRRCRIVFRGIELAFFVDGEDHIQEILSWLADGLGSEAADCPVHLIFNWSATNPLLVTTVPPGLVVKHISILGSMSEPAREALYDEMAQPLDSTPSGQLYPQMESLSVEFGSMESQKQLVSMLRSRYEGESLVGETELVRCPASLRSVELRGRPRTQGLVEEIREILREANVFWADEETEP